MKKSLLVPAIAGLLLSIAPAAASAQTDVFCPQRSSIFGTVEGNVSGNRLTLRTETDDGNIPVRFRGATIHANGLQLRTGVFAGVFGCLNPGDRSFRAEEITLATSETTYPYDRDQVVTLQGRIDAVRDGRVLIDSNHGHGNLWVQTNRDDLRTGQLIRVRGTFTQGNRSFNASSVTIINR